MSEQTICGITYRMPDAWETAKHPDIDDFYIYYPEGVEVGEKVSVRVSYYRPDEGLTSDTLGVAMDSYAQLLQEESTEFEKESYPAWGEYAIKVTCVLDYVDRTQDITVYAAPVNTDGIFRIVFQSNKDAYDYQPYYRLILDSVLFPGAEDSD